MVLITSNAYIYIYIYVYIYVCLAEYSVHWQQTVVKFKYNIIVRWKNGCELQTLNSLGNTTPHHPYERIPYGILRSVK